MRRALIGQLSSALRLAEYLKRETEMLRPLPYCDAVSRRDETKTIKPIINEAFVASSGDIITDYNDLRHGHTALSVPLTSIHTHANASVRKRKPVRKVFAFRCVPKFKLGELWPVNSHHVTPCDQRQIDTSQHDLLANLKERTFKTTAQRESVVDCMFLHFRCIIICHVEFKFVKRRCRA